MDNDRLAVVKETAKKYYNLLTREIAVIDSRYHNDLPALLEPWYVYPTDAGHSIFCLLAEMEEDAFSSGETHRHTIPIPVKAVLQNYEIREGFIIALSGELSYDEFSGLQCPSVYEEFSADEKPLNTMTVGKKYPLPVISGEGSAAQFLNTDGNFLQVCMPQLSLSEKEVYEKNKISVGMIVKGPAILLLFQFGDSNSKDILSCPFNSKIYQEKGNLNLPDITNERQALSIQLHLVDTQTYILEAKRNFQLSPEFTLHFLSAVQDQLASSFGKDDFDSSLQKLFGFSDLQLVKKTFMYPCGESD